MYLYTKHSRSNLCQEHPSASLFEQKPQQSFILLTFNWKERTCVWRPTYILKTSDASNHPFIIIDIHLKRRHTLALHSVVLVSKFKQEREVYPHNAPLWCFRQLQRYRRCKNSLKPPCRTHPHHGTIKAVIIVRTIFIAITTTIVNQSYMVTNRMPQKVIIR